MNFSEPEYTKALLNGSSDDGDTEVRAELNGEGDEQFRSPADDEGMLFASSSSGARGGRMQRDNSSASTSIQYRTVSDDELETRSNSRLRGAQTNPLKRSSRDHGDGFKFGKLLVRGNNRIRKFSGQLALDAPMLLGRVNKSRLVTLPDDEMERVVGVYHTADAEEGQRGFSLSPEHQRHAVPVSNAPSEGTLKRSTCICCAEKFDLEKIYSLFKHRAKAKIVIRFIEAIYVSGLRNDCAGGSSGNATYIFMNYGVAVIWGSTEEFEAAILKMTEHCMLDPHEIEKDVFSYKYNSAAKSYIQNDVISIGRADDTSEKIKMAISHALAQSTKMSVLEERVRKIIIETLPIPKQLAASGHVTVSRQEVNKLCGKVFLQKTAVNLLDSVLDTPEYFWNQTDSLQLLYEKVGEYVEVSVCAIGLLSTFPFPCEARGRHQPLYRDMRLTVNAFHFRWHPCIVHRPCVAPARGKDRGHQLSLSAAPRHARAGSRLSEHEPLLQT